MRQLPKEVLRIIEERNKEVFGVTVAELRESIKQHQENRERIKREIEQIKSSTDQIKREIEQKKKATKEVISLEELQVNTIMIIHEKLEMGADRIAKLLDLDLAFVKKTLKSKP